MELAMTIKVLTLLMVSTLLYGCNTKERGAELHFATSGEYPPFEYQENELQAGFIDYNLNIILPIEYEIGNFKDGFATIGKNNLYGFIDESKQIVIPIKFDRVWSFFDGVAKAIYKGKNVYIDTKGKILFESDINPETMQESIGFFYEGLAIKIKNGKYGFVNKNGEEIIPIIYDNAHEFKDGTALVFKNKNPFYINMKGDKIK
jgi:hypothetical protein